MPKVRISTGMTSSTLMGVKVTFLNTCGHISNGGVHVEPESLFSYLFRSWSLDLGV